MKLLSLLCDYTYNRLKAINKYIYLIKYVYGEAITSVRINEGITCKVVHGLGRTEFGLNPHRLNPPLYPTLPDLVDQILTHLQLEWVIESGKSGFQWVAVDLVGFEDLENGEDLIKWWLKSTKIKWDLTKSN